MSLSSDVLLFSIVLMLWAVRVEARGYGDSGEIVLASLALGVAGLLGSFVSTAMGTDHTADAESTA
jgi:hypothetical protein